MKNGELWLNDLRLSSEITKEDIKASSMPYTERTVEDSFAYSFSDADTIRIGDSDFTVRVYFGVYKKPLIELSPAIIGNTWGTFHRQEAAFNVANAALVKNLGHPHVSIQRLNGITNEYHYPWGKISLRKNTDKNSLSQDAGRIYIQFRDTLEAEAKRKFLQEGAKL